MIPCLVVMLQIAQFTIRPHTLLGNVIAASNLSVDQTHCLIVALVIHLDLKRLLAKNKA